MEQARHLYILGSKLIKGHASCLIKGIKELVVSLFHDYILDACMEVFALYVVVESVMAYTYTRVEEY